MPAGRERGRVKRSPVKRPPSGLRVPLIAVLIVVGVNAVGGGIYGLAGAHDVATEWLEGSPFNDYFWPSLILLVAVGGGHLVAASALLARARRAPWFALAAGLALVIWIVVEVAIITLNSLLQPAFLLIGLIEMAAAAMLLRRQTPSARETAPPGTPSA